MANDRRRMLWALAVGTVLLGLSLIGMWFYVDFVEALPFYTSEYDPEMQYLLNSLAIFKSRPYMYFDHPGTPVEVIGTIILALMRPAVKLGSDAFWKFVLVRPDSFLRVAHGLLTLGSMVTLALLCMRAVRVERWTDVPIALGVGASYFVLLPDHALRTLTFWSHNSFNFPAGTLILLALLIRLRSARPLQPWEIVLAGIATGALTAVQLYFATWVLGVAIAMGLFVALRERGVIGGLLAAAGVGASSLLGFALATGPILHRYREFAWWVKSLIIHQGRYGRGPTGAPSVASLLANLAGLWRAAPVLFVAAGIVLGTVCAAGYVNRKKMRELPGWWSLALALSVQFVAAMLLIAKHPAPLYLLAPAAIAPLLFILSLDVLRTLGRRLRLLCASIGLALLLLFPISLVGAMNRHRAEVNAFAQREEEISQQIKTQAARLGESPDSLVILWGFGMESRCYALRFGDRYTGRAFADEINEICAKDWTYEASVDLAELPEGSRPLAEAQGWDLLIIKSSDLRSDYEQYGSVAYSADRSIAFLRPLSDGR